MVKIWSYGDDAYTRWYSWQGLQTEARDVAVSEADGSIYVTGFVMAYTHQELRIDQRQCFVLRLDGQLNRIDARSFGYASAWTWSFGMVCNSIQVSRNGDFIYLGGTHQMND